MVKKVVSLNNIELTGFSRLAFKDTDSQIAFGTEALALLTDFAAAAVEDMAGFEQALSHSVLATVPLLTDFALKRFANVNNQRLTRELHELASHHFFRIFKHLFFVP